MFAVATISSTLCTIESYLDLHDLCVFFVCFGVCFYVFLLVFLCVYGPSAWNKTDDDDDDDDDNNSTGVVILL